MRKNTAKKLTAPQTSPPPRSTPRPQQKSAHYKRLSENINTIAEINSKKHEQPRYSAFALIQLSSISDFIGRP